jgi:hypothetical protein
MPPEVYVEWLHDRASVGGKVRHSESKINPQEGTMKQLVLNGGCLFRHQWQSTNTTDNHYWLWPIWYMIAEHLKMWTTMEGVMRSWRSPLQPLHHC